MGIKEWNALREAATQGYADAVMCLATIEAVEISNDPEVLGGINDASAGMVARLYQQSALFRLHVFVCRAFSPVRHRDDLHLRAAIDFIREPGRIGEVQWESDREDLRKSVELFDRAARDPRLERLNHFRNKLMVHFARQGDVPSPTYDDLFGFARTTSEIWQQLSFGSGAMKVEVVHQVDEYRESALAFWSPWKLPIKE